MSRIPRNQEYLKAGFTAEAAAAARFRAYAGRARRDGYPNLAQRFEDLARAKDELSIRQLEAAGQVRGAGEDLAAALAEERYENDVLYRKMIDESAGDTVAVLRGVVDEQQGHARELERLREAWTASRGDVPAGA